MTTAYTQEQFRDIYPDSIEYHYWNRARNTIIYHFLIKNGLQRENILDIGCGRGIVLQYLKQKKISCSGVDVADTEPITGMKDCIVTRTDAFDLPLEFRNTVTSVMLLDVIEHFEAPSTFLDQVVDKFPFVRTILITVPARQELWSNYDEYNGHFGRYSLSDGNKLAGRELKLIEAGYFNHLLYPVFWIITRMLKKRETSVKAPSGWKIRFHHFISWILIADYHMLPARMRGTSIIALYSVLRH